MSLGGLIAAVHTPLRPDGTLNLEQVDRQARHVATAGVSGVFVGGTTGEAHSLTVDERLALARRWLQAGPAHGLKVVVHVGHNCQADARALAAGASTADAVAALAPSYFKPETVDALLDFLAPVAAAAGVPFYYYDIPALTGVRLSMVELLQRGPERVPTLAGLKYTNPDLVQYQECRAVGGRFTLLFGCDEILLAAVALGAPGAVGSTYNFAAPLYRRAWTAFERGDLETARAAQARAVEAIRILGRYGFLAASKAVMAILGVDCGPVRPPLRNLSAAEQAALRRDLETTGLLDEFGA